MVSTRAKYESYNYSWCRKLTAKQEINLLAARVGTVHQPPCYESANEARPPRIQRLRCSAAALHNGVVLSNHDFLGPCQRGGSSGTAKLKSPEGAVTLGRRAAAWFTRSTTDCSAFPTSSDIATFHIPSSGYETERELRLHDDASQLSK